MNRHGRRLINLQAFKSHASSLNLRFLGDDELEFYEKHCLMLPSVQLRRPPAHLIAVTQRNLGWPVTNPEDLVPSDTWRSLRWSHVDGLHPFDAEREHNPLLLTPDCSTFEPWDTDDRITLAAPDGNTERLTTVERHYSPWQVHVVEFLQQRKYYYAYSRFLRHVAPSHDLWSRHRLPVDTERTRSLRGMANGFEALERFLFAEQAAFEDAFHGVDDGVPLSKPAQHRLHATVTTWARRSLELSGLDEPAFFQFLSELTGLIDDYRRDERMALAEDAEQYLYDAQRLAGYVFEYDWDGLLAAAEEHFGSGLVAHLRWLDPVEAAARDTKGILTAILRQGHVAAIADEYGDAGTTPDEIVKFCLDRDLFEVLYGLQHYLYNSADRRRDRFPGFFHRRLRPLAFAGEQLARGILVAWAEGGHASSARLHQEGYRDLVKNLGEESSWVALFNKSKTSDSEQGDLDQRAVRLAEAALAAGAERDEVIAKTFAAAVAVRNFVSHRHRLLSPRDARALAGSCADAVVLIWLVARNRGFV